MAKSKAQTIKNKWIKKCHIPDLEQAFSDVENGG